MTRHHETGRPWPHTTVGDESFSQAGASETLAQILRKTPRAASVLVGGETLLVRSCGLAMDRFTFRDGHASCEPVATSTSASASAARIAAGGGYVWASTWDAVLRGDHQGFEPAYVLPRISQREGGTLLWDATYESLLLVGDYDRNDIWALDARGVRMLGHTPWTTRAQTVSTPSGIFGVERDGTLYQLSRTGRHRRRRSTRGASASSVAMFYDARRDALIELVRRGAEPAWELACGERRIALLHVPACLVEEREEEVLSFVDARCDRLFVCDRTSVFSVSLDSLGDERIGLPAMSAFNRPARPTRGRTAHVLRCGARAEPSPRFDGTLLAWLPNSELLPLAEAGSLAIVMVESPIVDDPFLLMDQCLPEFEALFLASRPQAPLIARGGDTYVAELVPFEDPEPLLVSEMDATESWGMTFDSKIGGYPRSFGDFGTLARARSLGTRLQTAAPCQRCGRETEFVLQLSQDLFPEIGWEGRVLVYLCPSGCAGSASIYYG